MAETMTAAGAAPRTEGGARRAVADPVLLAGLETALLGGRFPAVLLATGPRGVGLRALLLDIAQALICPQAEGLNACGRCPDCRQMKSGHSRVLWLLPNVSEETAAKIDAYGPERILQDPWTAPAPPASSQIPVGGDSTQPTYPLMTAGVRGLASRLAMSDKDVRVVLIPWAEHLNQSSSNSLLKLLEEPPPRVHFLLAAASADSVLPTIRSRSFIQAVPPLSTERVQAFLEARGFASDAAAEAAPRCLGRPGVALRMATPEARHLRTKGREWLELCLGPDPEAGLRWVLDSEELSAKDQRLAIGLVDAALGELATDLLSTTDRPRLERLDLLRASLERTRADIAGHCKPSMAFTSCLLAVHLE